jgi:hypothetical protein
MMATLRWAAPAALLMGALGCGQEATTAKKSPGAPQPKADGASASVGASLVILKVDGMH